MGRGIYICGLIAIALLIAFEAPKVCTAQSKSVVAKNSEGTEFWLCFMKNYRSVAPTDPQNRPDFLKLQLFLTSSFDATVRIEIEEIGYENVVEIRANTVVNCIIPPSAILRKNEVAERLAVHITADTTISVYGLNSRYQTTDTFLGLPVSVLGTEYRTVGYTKVTAEYLSSFSIVATEDETDITITPSVSTSTDRPAKQPFSVRLRKGDVYTVSARYESIGACDLTGSHIVANKRIAVFSGHNCAYVPPKVDACNHLVEQLPPISAWGMHYYLGMLKERSKYTYRVIASQDGTKVFEDSRLVAVLRSGEFFENLNVNRHVQITADHPILLAQFAQGFNNGDSVGDPMMIIVSPTQQFLNVYRFATPINGDWHHYINVIAPSQTISSIRLNGRRIDSSMFEVLGESRYSIAQIPIPFGTHVIKSDYPFGLYSYGFGYKSDAYDAYGNMAGQSFLEVTNLLDTLPPLSDGRDILDGYSVTFNDDRVSDKGLQSVQVESSVYLEASVPKIDAGAPRATVKIRPSKSSQNGRIVLKATDVAGNVTSITVCYVFDSRSERYRFLFSADKFAECASEEGWMVGAYPTIAHNFHSASFSSSGNVSVNGGFTGGQGLGYGFGILGGRRLSQDLIINARLSVTNKLGPLSAPDTLMQTVVDPSSGKELIYQEGTTLEITAPYLNVGGTVQWFPLRYLYLTGGFQFSFALSDAAEIQRGILRPSNWVFENGARTIPIGPQSLKSLSDVGFDLLGGIGISYPVSFRASVFMETLYIRRLNKVVDDATWNIEALALNIGALWRL